MRILIPFFFLLLLLLPSRPLLAQGRVSHDVVVYGATPAGIAAAVNAARQGATVGLFEETGHIGGLTSGGMSNTDFKTFEAVQGTFREFMDRVVAHYTKTYGASSQQVKDCYHGAWYEPKVARQVFEEMLKEQPKIRVYLRHRLENAVVPAAPGRKRITAARFRNLSGNGTLEAGGKVFIDATYEGDLMAVAGCPYRVGRESRKEYGELFAGLKYYHDGKFLPGSTGEADHRIQCYNFRLCMTTDPANQVRITEPASYDRTEFLPLLELMKSGKVKSVAEGVVRFRGIPNAKADVNDIMYSPFSLRLPGENYDWPEGDAAVRQRIFDRHKHYSLGLFYFLQNDPEVPTAIREEANRWGLPRDEFTDSNHFPPVLYVREGRRLKGDYVLTEADTQPVPGGVRAPAHTDAVAVCDYSIDSHGTAPPGPMHPGITEGVFNYPVVPFGIPYRAMVPPGVDGLLVPVAVSATHVGFSALRMEPTWTALGQAAGLAAALAVRQQKEVREIQVAVLQAQLYREKAITVYLSDVLPDSKYFRASQYFGTKGFFHHLPEYQNIAYTGRGKPLGVGQWIEAYPHHALSPEKPMEGELAVVWVKMAGVIRPVNLQTGNGLTRGEFLLRLYDQIATYATVPKN